MVTANSVEECNRSIQMHTNTLVIIDEESPFLTQKTEDIRSVIRFTYNKYLIISRDKKLTSLPILMKAVWIVVNANKLNIVKRRYSR